MASLVSRHVFPLSHLVDLTLTSSGISFPLGQPQFLLSVRHSKLVVAPVP